MWERWTCPAGASPDCAGRASDQSTALRRASPWQTAGPITRWQNVPGLIERLEDGIALKRWGYGDDVADVVLFFASDASRYVTGEVVAVDGGMARVGAAPPRRD